MKHGRDGARPSIHGMFLVSIFVIPHLSRLSGRRYISLYIDARLASVPGYGRSYQGDLAPGLHLVTMRQTPHLNDAYPYSQQWIRVAPGRTSVFTAIWRNGGTRIALEGS